MRPISDLTRRVEPFRVISDYVPAGDQPSAISELVARLANNEQDIVLLGATGTGKSATTVSTLFLTMTTTNQRRMFLKLIHLLRKTRR